ncbi:MAG: hypothetical protein ACYTBS_27510 [Planctomycetota bacterium]
MSKSLSVASSSASAPWQERSFPGSILYLAFVALLTSNAMAAPRGLIVQIGGACPATGQGRVIHYLLGNQAAVDEARITHRGQDSVRVDLLSGSRLPYAENIVRHLVCEIPEALSRAEVMRVLRPLGNHGVAG